MDSCGGINSAKLPLRGQGNSPSSQNHQAPSPQSLTFTEVLLSHPHTQATLHSSMFQAHEYHISRPNPQAQEAPRASNGSDALSLPQIFAVGIGGCNPQFPFPVIQGIQVPKNLLKDSSFGSPQAEKATSEAFMNALALLRQNIEHLQTLVQLVAQGGNFSAAAIQQQMKAAAGMATVISQLITLAAGLLPQSHQSTQSALCFPTNHSPAEAIHGVNVFQNNSSEGSLAAALGVFDGNSTLGEERHNSMDIGCYVGDSGLDGSMDLTAEHFLATNQRSIPTNSSLRTSVTNVEMESELNESRRRFCENFTPSSGLEVSNDNHAMFQETLEMNGSLEDQYPAYGLQDEEDEDEAEHLPLGSYELIELDAMEILAEHTHFCEICGKGFKRDANLRMHMRGHGDEYKTAAALAKPDKFSQDASLRRPRRYSCPYPGCKRNKKHKKFLPLKTMLCVKNHYRRSHCPKILTCSKCKVKTFSVVADLKTHEKHCGQEKWQCSCGTTFSRKDKLLGHVALFVGHTPATRLFESESPGSGNKGKNEMVSCNANLSAASSPKRFGKCSANTGGLCAGNGPRFKSGDNVESGSDTKPEILSAAVLAVVNHFGLGAGVGGSNLLWQDPNIPSCSVDSSDSENSVAISESLVSALSSLGQVGNASLLTAASNVHGFCSNSFVHSPNVSNQSTN